MRSAVIVAYKNGEFIEDNLRFLIKNGYEVVLAVDDPDDDLRTVIDKYGVKATVSRVRRGKWRALNDALKLVSGETILFLDSDTKIIELAETNGKDAVEIRKEVMANSVLERLVGIDYFVMFLTSKLAEKFNSCLSLNGAALVIKRRVLEELGGFRRRINEDTDLGVRLGLKGFKVGVGGRAVTKAPSSFREWFSQRERWSLGGAEAIIENFFKIVKRPRLWIPYLFLFYPAFVGMLFEFLLPDDLVIKLLYLLIPLMVFLSPKLLSIAMLTIFEIHTLKNILAALVSFLIWFLTISVLSRILDYKIDIKLLPLYYFFYSPLWTMICIVAFFRVLISRITGRRISVRGWKV